MRWAAPCNADSRPRWFGACTAASLALALVAPGIPHAQPDVPAVRHPLPRFQTGERIAAPASVTATQLRVAGIRSEDIRLFLSADKAYPAGSIGLQCQGANDTLTRIPVVRLVNRPVTVDGARPPAGHDDRDSQRFGPTDDDATGRALRFVVDARDPLPDGVPPRCEVFGYPRPETALPSDSVFWFAVSLWIDDWKNTQDEQIVTQWHQNDPRLSLNPFLAVVVRGDELRLELRSSLADPATRQTTTTVTAVTRRFVPRQWMALTFKARLAPPGSGRSQVTMWMDGDAIATHRGDIGYKILSGSFTYAKTGIYKWINGNPWDMTSERRELLVRQIILLEDKTDSYDIANFRSIEQR